MSVLFAALFLTLTLFLSVFSERLPTKSWSNSIKAAYGHGSSKQAQGEGLSVERQVDHTMSHAECKREFPLLFDQLEENAAAWRYKGGIKYRNLEEASAKCIDGCARFIIKDGRIFIRNYTVGPQSRVRGVLTLFRTAVEAASAADKARFEGVDVILNALDSDETDAGDGVGWVLTKEGSDPPGRYLLPDFSFAAWPEAGIGSYGEFRRDAKAINEAMTWHQKADRAFFRGDPSVGSAARADLMEQVKLPGASVWSDVRATSFFDESAHIAPHVPIAEHCKHKYLLHSEGISYSGRSKFLLGCSSAVITHNLTWTQHFHPALISNPQSPDQNVLIPPEPYFHHLAEFMADLHAQDVGAYATSGMSLGQRVAANAERTLVQRYLSPAATMCYTRGALISYSSVLDRTSFPGGQTEVLPGGGVVPNSGMRPMEDLRQSIKGDIDLTTWELLDHPIWPP
ncbi:hypothetical protein BCV69DRAFT_289820 [Microstroma glucosiphilum]|uniref:Glycosyl transferase CAP10 domain-containing protein n=1 Tax=Pseudomicrostroma glucosiphilum TaxID=1684307 RepID=A0A316U9M5_9BASI|nr:hypothetical protein BCV69DRAFT_289820 [Pseudomicrostroma glucosiphilum]PWN21859.1 hypothetical protein BCV69DRAFT_289820 [Pseudomicrostroma glucosiphilum]